MARIKVRGSGALEHSASLAQVTYHDSMEAIAVNTDIASKYRITAV
jgi:hypothetical protein